MAMLQQARTRSERERHIILEHHLTERKLRDAEETLALVAPQQALRSLTELVAVSTKRHRWYKLVANTLYGSLLGALVLYAVFIGSFSPMISVFVLMGLNSFRKSAGQRPKYCRETALLVLPNILKQVGRQELGLLLELAPWVLDHQPVGSQVRDLLGRLLPRVPTDELQALTSPQRAALQTVTVHALGEARENPFFEPVAIGGLLALGTLQDPALVQELKKLQEHQPTHRLYAAAQEYLEALARP
jgi:hypothetical protein